MLDAVKPARRHPLSSFIIPPALAVLCLGIAGRASAQLPAMVAPPSPPPIRVDLAKVPIDVGRIARAIEAARVTEREDTRDPFHLEYYVQVYGQAPLPDFFANFDLKSGPVPFSAPTHQDFLNLVTPKEFRAGSYGGINLQQLIAWLAGQLARKRDSQ